MFLNQPETALGIDALHRAQAGDPDAFCELVREHEERLFRQALVLCRDAALAEDLAQDTLFTAWKQIRQFNQQCQLFTWLCGILLNLSRNAARKKSAIPVSVLSEESREQANHAIETIADPAGSPIERLHQEERSEALQRCLDRLPEKHREVIYLRYFVDDSLDAIANVLDCSIGTVKSRLFNALEKLYAMPEIARLARPENPP